MGSGSERENREETAGMKAHPVEPRPKRNKSNAAQTCNTSIPVCNFDKMDVPPTAGEVPDQPRKDTEAKQAPTGIPGMTDQEFQSLTAEEVNATMTMMQKQVDKIEIGNDAELTQPQITQVKALCLAYADIFQLPKINTKCQEHGVAAQLKLIAEPKFVARTRPMHPAQRAALTPLIADQIRKGIIIESKSATTSPALLVPKPGGKWRFVVDYTQLNKVTASDAYSVPRIDEYFQSLGGNKYFSSFDLIDAFWSVPLAPESQNLTAFNCPDGLFHYLKMPQGIKQGPAIFSRFIDQVFGSLKWDVCITYIDDLIAYTRTFEAHMQALENIFSRVREYGLFFKPEKCKILTRKLKFLGHIISCEGIGLDPDKAKAVCEMPPPVTRKQLRSTLGFMGYFRKYIKDYSRIVSPLQIQLRGGEKGDKKHAKGKVDWSSDEVKDAWKFLIEALTSAPILSHPDWTCPFIVHVDACKHGLGATLTQKYDDGTETVVMYASKSLTPTEQKYNIWELECMAAVWAVTKVFKQYLLPPYGGKFTIYTDNSTVASVFNPERENGFSSRVAHWKLRLSEFDYVISHKPGKTNVLADHLSRCSLLHTCPYGEDPLQPLYQIPAGDEEKSTEPAAEQNRNQPPKIYTAPPSVSIPANSFSSTPPHWPPADLEADTLQRFVDLQRIDANCKALIESIEKGKKIPFMIDTETRALYHTVEALPPEKSERSLKRLVVPDSLKRHIIFRAHGLIHQGSKRTLRLINSRYYWARMTEDITRWCGCCLVCRKRKTTRPWGDGVPKTMSCDRPMQRIAMDLIGKFKKSDDHEYVLTMIDVFTRFTITVPIANKQPSTIGNAIFQHLICVFGVPESILTDQGREFCNQGLTSMCRQFDIRKIKCSPHSNSKGNGHIERWHRLVNSSMYALQLTHGAKWSHYVHAVAFAYNLVANEATGFSPYMLMFGRHPTLPDDVSHGFNAHAENATQANYHIRAGKIMKEAYDSVRARQMTAAEKNRAAREQGSDLKTYKQGDQVLLFNPGQPAYTIEDGDVAIVAGSPRKWTPQWTGPHLIHQKRGNNNYDVLSGKSGTIFEAQNVNSLHPWSQWSDSVSSTSQDYDLAVPWTYGGLPGANSLVAVAFETTFEVGKLTSGPASQDETIHFQWWSNESNNHDLPIRPMWYTPSKPGKKGAKPPEEIPYFAQHRKHPSDKPWTDVETETVTTSRDLMLNGFVLTKAGKIPIPVQWATKHSRKIYFNAANAEADDTGIAEDGDMHRVDYNAQE